MLISELKHITWHCDKHDVTLHLCNEGWFSIYGLRYGKICGDESWIDIIGDDVIRFNLRKNDVQHILLQEYEMPIEYCKFIANEIK